MTNKLILENIEKITRETNFQKNNITTVCELFFIEKCTIPFIARYRKEKTGGLDEVAIEEITNTYQEFLELEKRRNYILQALEKLDQLDDGLRRKIREAQDLLCLEDLYAPYKSKKKTKAIVAKEAGLGPLLEIIKNSTLSFSDIEAKEVPSFLNPKMKIVTIADALEGAQNIAVEEMAHLVEAKERLRDEYWRQATFKSGKKKYCEKIKDYEKFRDYFEFEQKISELKEAKNGHRFLAIQRGVSLNILKEELNYPLEEGEKILLAIYLKGMKTSSQDFFEEAANKAMKNYLHKSLMNEIRSSLKEVADDSAIDVFKVNLRNLLLQPYLGPKAVLGIDPGVRSGCKIALIDKNGNFMADTVIYPHPPQMDITGAKKVIEACLQQVDIQYIAVGSGTYGRETLYFLQENIADVKSGKTKAVLVNEDGASIYSASKIAREEFPDKDVTIRGAISIARRFQDPLAELVKIDPKSLGIGQYQHDVNAQKMKVSLQTVVESCVNHVGVDLNTASAPLLSHVSGIGPSLAENIVKQREKIGGFKKRDDLEHVPRFSSKAFEQCAGFLRIYNGSNPLDATFIHPERYSVLSNWAKRNKIALEDLSKAEVIEILAQDEELKTKVGPYTHNDIIDSLSAPKQDPRTEFKPFEYRSDIKTIEDLKIGEWYPGIIANITQFGAFVDIGIKESGLIHVSQMAEKFVNNALEVVKIGQEVKARILEVDLERKRISMTLREKNREVPKGFKKKLPKAPKNIIRNQKKQPPKEIKNTQLAALKNIKLSN